MPETIRNDAGRVVTSSSSENPAPKKVKATPLPKMKMLAVAATLFTESICTTMLLPFVGLYVSHLQGVAVEGAGYSSGILVGLFMLGQVLSSKMWGWLSDVYGRKPPLTFGLFVAGWFMLFFGMAPNIYVCCLMRFIHGFFNGNILIAKIIIADITDSTNAALGFSMIGLLWSVGAVIGPALGGFLYDPLDNPKLQWLHVQPDSFLGRNPAFLPSLFVFLYTMATFVFVVVVVPETNLKHTGSIRNIPVVGWIMNRWRPKSVTITEANLPIPGPEPSHAGEQTTPQAKPKIPQMTFLKSFKDPVHSNIILLVMCVCAMDMTFQEVMPLWAIAPRDVGGMGMFSDRVGILMLSFAVPTFVSNLSFPQIYKRVGNLVYMWRVGISTVAIAIMLVPFASNLSEGIGFWFVLLFGCVKQGVGSMCFTMVNLLTAKAAPPGTIGSIYGINQSVNAGTRCVVPFIVTPLFAWSLSGDHSFPFNHYFVFLLTGVPAAFSIVITYRRRIERTAEELAEWEEERDEVRKGETENPYRSLANSLVQGDSGCYNLPAMEEESERQGLVMNWMRFTIPKGRGAKLQVAVKELLSEDFRVVTDEDIQVNEIK